MILADIKNPYIAVGIDKEMFINKALKKVVEIFDVDYETISSKDKHRNVVHARWVLWLILYDNGYSLKKCGEFTGGHDHSTVSTGINQLHHDIKNLDYLKEKVKHVEIYFKQTA